MITCPSCNHQNPEGSLQCENCYTPLPATASCPNCGASVQTDATFCGQCGFNLQAENSSPSTLEETALDSLPNTVVEEAPLPDRMPLSEINSDILPETAVSSTPIKSPWDEDLEPINAQHQQFTEDFPDLEPTETVEPTPAETEVESERSYGDEMNVPEEPESAFDLEPVPEPQEILSNTEESAATVAEHPETIAKYEIPFEPEPKEPARAKVPTIDTMAGATQLQMQTAYLLHLQTNTNIEIPAGTNIVHIGKPNAQIPPDIDVAGFPDSEVVSRVHADIRIEGDAFYIEDMGSSNGTYINHSPLPEGNRHRLRTGDRIALGKGDLVTFIFQLS